MAKMMTLEKVRAAGEKTQRALADLRKAVRTRRGILVCYALASALACLWVPWNVHGPTGARERFKHGFLWSPPRGYRTFPQPPNGSTMKEFTRWSNLAIEAAKMNDLKLAALASDRASSLTAQSEQEMRDWEKLVDQYERTTLEIRWGELSLELMALTALCGAALLVIPRKVNPN